MTFGFSQTEMNRLFGCLDRLLPCVHLGRVAIAGSVGMQLNMVAQGRTGPRTEIADLDLVAASAGDITPRTVERFLVSHYHVVGPGVPKFMIQLVDPISSIRVDIFPDLVGSLADAQTISIGGHSVQILSLERIFEHKIQTLSRASRSAPIDPKHVRDARLLGSVLDRMTPTVPDEALAPDVYGVDDDGSCERCELSRHPDWPLGPKDRILDLLGWSRRKG